VTSASTAQTLALVVVGFALIPICLVSIVLWPFLFPAALLVAYGLSQPRGKTLQEVVASVLAAVSIVTAFGILLFHQDPATWTSQMGVEVQATSSRRPKRLEL